MKTDVLIIGAGLIGSMTAKYLRSKGMEVVIVDEENTMSASKCSFGVWKEGWVNKVIKAEYEDGIELLDKVVGGIKELEFTIKPKPYKSRSMIDKYKPKQTIIHETFKRADCSLILNEPFIGGTVVSIDGNRVRVENGDKAEVIVAKHIVVAAGVWTTDILMQNGLTNNMPYLDFQWGTVFKLKGLDLPLENQMKEWSPYKQSVFVRTSMSTALFGDGAVVKNPKKDDPRLKMASDRVLVHMNELLGTKKHGGNITDVMEGYRPYLNGAKSHTGKFVNVHSDYVMSATGGAKNSTILCGHMAKEIYRQIKKRKK